MATVQVAACYFTLVRPYINTVLYEAGRERLPFQTRLLLMPIMRWARTSEWAASGAAYLAQSQFWYLRRPEPEAIVQFGINIVCLIVAGYVSVRLHRAASKGAASKGPGSERSGSGASPAADSGFLDAFVYPVFLLLCASHYILHTIQNFRFPYDFPSMAFFAVGLYLIYFRKPALWFAALFVVATLNRETTLLLLPFYMLSAAAAHGEFDWRKAVQLRVWVVVLPLTAFWFGWHLFVFHLFRNNASEYYPRIWLNLYTLGHPRYWPQLFSAGGFLLPFVLLFRRSIADPQLRAWLWALPVWFGFMFFWGILVETRVFGELLPYLACIAVLIAEDRIHRQLCGQSGEEVLLIGPHRETSGREDADVLTGEAA